MQAMCVRPHLNSNHEAMRRAKQSNLAEAVAVKVKFRVALDWITSNKTPWSLRCKEASYYGQLIVHM
jgi:hypothetical protein